MSERLAFNGVDADTGEPLFLPAEAAAVAAEALAEVGDPQHLKALKARQHAADGTFLGLTTRADPDRLEEAGWGVIFARELGDDPADVREALKPLLAWREGEAGARFWEYAGNRAPVLTGPTPETALDFAARHGQGPGPVDPKLMPYYVLIVGSPEQVSYLFQYQLATQFAVGRPLVSADAPVVKKIHDAAQADGGGYRSLITAIVTSDLVQMTRTERIQ